MCVLYVLRTFFGKRFAAGFRTGSFAPTVWLKMKNKKIFLFRIHDDASKYYTIIIPEENIIFRRERAEFQCRAK